MGTPGAPCHEDRALGARRVIGQYPDMEIVETEYDRDTVELAYQYTREPPRPTRDGPFYR